MLLRLLRQHPFSTLQLVTSRNQAGESVFDHRHRPIDQMSYQLPEQASFQDCDAVFFAAPAGTAATMIADPQYQLGQVKHLIDLSADFRLKDAQIWSKNYQMAHPAPELLPEAIYGIPELYGDALKEARIIACPGCYPTSAALPLAPLLKAGLIQQQGIIVNSASGVTGAGRKTEVQYLFGEITENFKAYGLAGHRHQDEMRQTIDAFSSVNEGSKQGTGKGEGANLLFVPHLLPVAQGILSTIYCDLTAGSSLRDVQNHLRSFYANSPLVDVLDEGDILDLRSVVGGNQCLIQIHNASEVPGKLVILSALDNLLKGAAGQAIQCYNLAMGFPELCGLTAD